MTRSTSRTGQVVVVGDFVEDPYDEVRATEQLPHHALGPLYRKVRRVRTTQD